MQQESGKARFGDVSDRSHSMRSAGCRQPKDDSPAELLPTSSVPTLITSRRELIKPDRVRRLLKSNLA